MESIHTQHTGDLPTIRTCLKSDEHGSRDTFFEL